MYHAVKSIEIKELIKIEAPSLLGATIIANSFYKFGSFFLELAAFLPTWFILSFLISSVFENFRTKHLG